MKRGDIVNSENGPGVVTDIQDIEAINGCMHKYARVRIVYIDDDAVYHMIMWELVSDLIVIKES